MLETLLSFTESAELSGINKILTSKDDSSIRVGRAENI